MLRITLKSHSTICIFTRSHKKMWVSYVTGTPKMSQTGSLIGTHLHNDLVILIHFDCRSIADKCKYLVSINSILHILPIIIHSFKGRFSNRGKMFGQALAQWRAFSLAVARSSRLHSFSRSGHLSRCCMVCSEVPHSQAVSAVSA